MPALASAGPGAVAADSTPRFYSRARLVDEKGAPILAKAIPANRNLIFHYPFAATPCFLLNLGRPASTSVRLKTAANEAYEWKGGVGAGRSVVAYSAICAHKMTYPTRQVSFIGYRDGPSPVAGKGKVITCCSDRSVYDPSAGARVVSGPAPQPLATILLEHDAKSDEVRAVGTFGGTVEGPNGLQIRLPEGAVQRGIVFKLEDVPPASIPVDKRPDLPGATLSSGVRIISEAKPTYRKEVDLVFPKPADAPAGSFFYVYRQVQGPNGKIVYQTIDKGVVEGDQVVTASPP